VCPGAEAGPALAGVGAAEGPGGGDEPAGVPCRVGVDPDGGVGEPGRQVSGGLGGFGGVLGEVAGDVLFGDLRAGQPAGDGQRLDVLAPLDDPALRPVRVGWGADRGEAGSVGEGLVE
jgi:hypothetical protein